MRTVNPSVSSIKKVVSILIIYENKQENRGDKSEVNYIW